MKRCSKIGLHMFLIGASLLCSGRYVQSKAMPLTGEKTKQAVSNVNIANQVADKKVVVKTQKELEKALKDKAVIMITIRTEKKVTLTISSNTNGKNKELVIDAPKATIKNKSSFKKIVIQNAASFKEEGKDNSITANGSKTSITIEKKGVVKKLILNKTNGKVKIDLKGSLKRLEVAKKASITITGPDTEIKVPITNLTGKSIAFVIGGKEFSLKANAKKTFVYKDSEHSDTGNTDNNSNANNNGNNGNNNNGNNNGNSNNGNNNGNNGNNGNNNGNENNGSEQEDDYQLVWSDEFTDNTLNTSKWSVELREPGWTNNELQRYTDSSDNIYIQDGKLILKANKQLGDKGTEYTSGKVTTRDKQSFTYGRFEIKAKVPAGQGLWPAIWMMPENESFYGQWPRCGEIDIMEVLGHETNKVYGTIHYGNPHKEQQGNYILQDTTFADDFHVYAMEWEPGQIRFFVDGILYKTVNDWYTKAAGGEEITYPAPFDQPFVLQLNLAVGGNWPGNPDETTNFEQAAFEVDYVRVYQKESYDENVTKPTVALREPDATGNYIVNGSFEEENLLDTENWFLLTALGGEANGIIENQTVRIHSQNEGTVDYSIQLLQAGIPMKKGATYRLTFDAKATEVRTMKVTISAPDREYVRHFDDTSVALTSTLRNYSYDFVVTRDDDANGRLEFNLGNQGSIGTVEISNVRLEKILEDLPAEEKTVDAEGNYIYNGKFEIGTGRLQYWEVESQVEGANIAVTNANNVRELKVIVPDVVTDIERVKVKQTRLGIHENTEYSLSFHAYGNEGKTIKIRIGGQEFLVAITESSTLYEIPFTTGEQLANRDLEFLLGVSGTTYLDNVKLVENKLIVNGDFNQGFSGWEVYVDSAIKSFVVSEVNETTGEKAAALHIGNTGDAEYKIQLKQNNIKLIEGQWYRLTLSGKSSLDRTIKVLLQRDGSVDNDWTPYGIMDVHLKEEYQNYELIFKMDKTTDIRTILSISMGAVNQEAITEVQHSIYIDHVILEEIEKPEIPEENGPEIIIGDEMMKNGDFSKGSANWEVYVFTEEAAAITSFENNQVKFEIDNVGKANWHIQLKQGGLFLEKGKSYEVEYTISSTVSRSIEMGLLTPENNWYGGDTIQVAPDNNEVTGKFYVNVREELPNAFVNFIVSLGQVGASDQPGTVIIYKISVKKIN